MIDLYSDTVTRPTPAMREAIARAEVGDEQRGLDPTTRALEERVAALVSRPAALYLPSASQANAIAMCLHCGPGDELLAAENSHVLCFEGGGPAVHARASGRGIPTADGTFGRRELEERLRPAMPHCPRLRLIAVENTTNMGGGRPWPRPLLDEVVTFARGSGLGLHLDGARIWHAAVAQNCPVHELTRDFDTVSLCFSKGLGAPMGAVLAMPAEWREQALRLKHLMGGALRQSGMMAAAALHALDHHLPRLDHDHRKAARLATGLQDLAIEVEACADRTNMVFFRGPEGLGERLAAAGLIVSGAGPGRYRAVTHLDVSDADIEAALEIVGGVLRSLPCPS